MKLSNIQKYPLFIIAGLVGAVVLIVLSELLGVTRTSFVPLSGASYAGWLYPVYFFVSFKIFSKVFDLPKRAMYYVLFVSVILAVWMHFVAFEGELFTNPIPFGINAMAI